MRENFRAASADERRLFDWQRYPVRFGEIAVGNRRCRRSETRAVFSAKRSRSGRSGRLSGRQNFKLIFLIIFVSKNVTKALINLRKKSGKYFTKRKNESDFLEFDFRNDRRLSVVSKIQQRPVETNPIDF